MCTIAGAKVQRNYNCYNVYFYECLQFIHLIELMEHRIGTNNRRKQFAGIGRDYLCDFQYGVQY